MRRETVLAGLAIFFWIMLSISPVTVTVTTTATLAIFFWIMRPVGRSFESFLLHTLLFSFELCSSSWMAAWTSCTTTVQRCGLAIFFWIMLTCISASQGLAGSTHLLFSFELCPACVAVLCAVFGWCFCACYFLLNYAKKVFRLSWRVWRVVACYFLLNYAILSVSVTSASAVRSTCYFLLNYATKHQDL